MFDATTRTGAAASTRWATTALSAAAHIAVLSALAISALYVTDTLPPPREVMAFVVTAPPVPPPPPPPAPAAPEPPKATPKTVARATPRPRTVAPEPAAAAPVEVPTGIRPETGLEGLSASSAVNAGFERGIPGGVIGGVVGGFESAPPPPPLPRPAAPVRVGGEITAPRVIRRVTPQYPMIAEAAQISGLVILEATVNHDGRVDDVRVLRSHPLLEDAAVEAVEQWVYEPLMLNGVPQPFVLTVTVSFTVPAR